jgi:zinc transport system substrate-binding protein
MPFLARSTAAAAALIVSVYGAAAAGSAAPPMVVVTSKPAHSLVAAVMQGVGTPVLLVDGNASPHSYALRPSQARDVQAAEVFVRVSAAVEPFSDDLIRTLPAAAQVISLAGAPGVATLELRTATAFEPHEEGEHEGHEHGHDGGDAIDGHVWLDPANAKSIAAHVAKVLSARDPANAARYEANRDDLKQRIDELSAKLAQDLASVRGKPFVVFHDATQYFERRFGLEAVGAIQMAPNVQPGAKRLSEVRARIAQSHAVCVFAEPWLRSRIVDTAVEGTAARIGVIDPEGTALPPGPDLYFALMRGLARDMAACLAK